jgi:hypothetical protein
LQLQARSGDADLGAGRGEVLATPLREHRQSDHPSPYFGKGKAKFRRTARRTL